MLKQMLRYKWYIAIIFALILIEPSINSVLNFWLQRLFNAAVPGAEKIYVLHLLTTGFLLWMLKRIVGFFASVLKARFICNAKQDVKHKMFINLMRLNTSNISSVTSSGEYISCFTNDIVLLETRFFEQVVGFISNLFSILILASSFFAMNLKLASAIVVFGALSAFVPLAFSKMLNEKNLAYSNTISIFTQKIKEYMVAYPTIKNYSIEKMIAKKFDQKNQETEDAKFEADYALNLANSIGSLLSWFMQFIAVGFGIVLVIRGEILVGTVIASQSFASDLASPLQNVIFNINSIRSVREVVRKIETLSNAPEVSEAPDTPEVDAAPVGTFAETCKDGCDIEFRELGLEIGGRKIIDQFSYRFERGKKYLIVGLNGSGKSSIFKSIKKWWGDCSGSVTLNDYDVSVLGSEEISQVVSYLNENVSLFSGSVRENIMLFREFASEAFERAVSDAQVRLDLEREISDEGRNISSGEQRRIEIARSLLKSVKVLIFDEVVSTLDIETAYEIEKLALGFEDKTVIFISHNFSGKLIREYDRILVISGGQLLAEGTYEDLMNSCDYFKRICEIKFG